MKKIIKLAIPIIFLAYLFGVSSCSEMDDYRDYTEGKPQLYTGRVDSVRFLSGHERIVFTGLLTSDPKIDKVKVYWNNRADSLVIDVVRTTEIDTLNVSIPLPEGRYNFEVYSYDGKGNPSIAVRKPGVSYGEDYINGLYNRVIKKAEKVGDDVIIDWYNGDETSPFVRIDYTDSNNTDRVLKIPGTEKNTVLENFKSMTKFKMQTYFLPDTAAVDTFKAEYRLIGVNEDITRLYIENPGSPFQRSDDGTGKWGILKDWQYSPDVLNQNNNTAGGWSTDSGGVIHFESKDWGGPGLTNGKIWQTISLSAGKYSVEFYSDGGGGGDNFNGNFLVSEGTGLPDIGQVDQSLALHRWNQNSMGGNRTITFTLDSPATVSIGWVVSFGSNVWMHINYVKLMSLNE